MNLRRLFALIPQINQVLLLLLLLGGGVAMLAGWWSSRSVEGVKVADTASGEPVAARLGFSQPELVRGTSVLMFELSSQRGGAPMSSSGYGGALRNLLFLQGGEVPPRWLFKNHQNLLRHVEQVSGDPDDPQEGDAAAIYVEYADADTNGDQRLTPADRFTVALTRPDGSGLQVLLKDVETVYRHTLLDEEQFAVIYQKGDAMRQARFQLKTGKLLADQELVKVPQAL